MYLQAGGGGKGIRPAQQQPQQFNQNQHSISQLQLHPNQTAHHQSNQSTHNIHTVQQQLPTAPLHLGHQQQQNLSHFPHTHQQNQQHPPPQQSQLSHPAPSYLVQLNQPPPTLPQSNNATPGPQMGSSPPMQGSNTSISSSSSGTQLQCFGSNNSINHNNHNNPTNIGRQQTVSNNNANMHFTGNTGIMPPGGAGYMTATFHMPPYPQPTPQPPPVMATTIYTASAASVGNHNSSNTPNTSQQAHFNAQHPQQPHPAMHPPQPLPYIQGNMVMPNPNMHHCRSMLGHHYFLLPQATFAAGARPPLLPNAHAHQQTSVTQVLPAPARGPMGAAAAYIQPPFCQPPLSICSPGLAPAQPFIPPAPAPTAPLQTFNSHMPPGSAIATTSSSSTSISSLNSNSDIVKPRKHAIPIINPDTMESIFEAKPHRKSPSLDTTSLNENTLATDDTETETDISLSSQPTNAVETNEVMQNEGVRHKVSKANNNRNSTNAVSSSLAGANASADEEEHDDSNSICSQAKRGLQDSTDYEEERITMVVEKLKISAKSDSVNDEVDHIANLTDVEADTARVSPSSPTSYKHLNNQEIIEKYLQPDANSTHGEADHSYEFLNKSVSPGEDEQEMNARLLLHQQQYAIDTQFELKTIRFGDFSEDKDSDEFSDTKSNDGSSSIPSAVFKNSNNDIGIGASSDINIKETISATEAVNVNSKLSVEAHSSVDRVVGGVDSQTSQTTDTTEDVKIEKIIKYKMDELKILSKSTESRKAPHIKIPPGSCISQLFLSRPHFYYHNHQQSNVLHQHLQQHYQPMNFNESLEFLSGKRRMQNKKHDLPSSGLGGNNVSNNANSSCNSNNPNSRKMDTIHINLSLKEEIKLSECENAWQPDSIRNKTSKPQAGSNDDIEIVLKKVRGVLNKLTPDNFDVLLKSMTNISINTTEKMQKVILLIFEKTISEPNFAPTYAKFCKVLFNETQVESKALITRIQHEFESNVNDAHAKKLKLQPLVEKLEKCDDPKERTELQAEIENQEYQFRRRAWGTVRFIGEMFKLQSLKSDRVLQCIESLLEHGSEEKLEYMCKLLSTVGHLLEGNIPEQNARMDKIFHKIHDIVNKSRNGNIHNKKQEKISSRVRFMMQDALDMRARNWDQPYSDKHAHRRSPTKQQQQQNEKNLASGTTNHANSNRTTGYVNQNLRHSHIRGIENQRDLNYFQQNKKLNYGQPSEQIDMNKLKFTRSEDITQFGNSLMYVWKTHGRAPATNSATGSSFTNTTNASVNVSSTSANVSESSSKRTTNPFQILDNQTTTSQSSVSSSNSSCNNSLSMSGYTTKECQNILNGLIEEVLDGGQDWPQEVTNKWQSANQNQQISLLHYLMFDYLYLWGTKSTQRKACAKIFTHLFRNKKSLDKKVFTKVYDTFADEFPDLLVDVPNGWTYVFEFLGPILHERVIQFPDIWRAQWKDEPISFIERFLKAMVTHFTNEFGANYMHELWHKEFKLDRGQLFFSNEEQWHRFIETNGFQHIAERLLKTSRPVQTKTNLKQNITTAEQVDRIEFLLTTANECDLAIDYINTNVNINSNFIKNLTKCLCCDLSTVILTNNNNSSSGASTSNMSSNTPKRIKKPQLKRHLNAELFRSKCTPLLRLCIDAREEYEIACLDAIVDALQQTYEDTTTASELICSVFDVLYECEIIPKESYDKWYHIHSAGASTSPRNGNARNAAGRDKGSASGKQTNNKHNNNNSRGRNNRLSDEIYTYIKKLL